MRRVISFLSVSLLLSACHDIQPTPSPFAPAPQPATPTTLTIVQSPGELPVGGGEAVFSIGVMSQAGTGVGDVPVALSATSGVLAASSARTDRAGYAAVQWSGTRAGTLTATVGDLIATSAIRVNAPPVMPPPSTPPAPQPQPAPDPPAPDPPPSLTVTLTSTPLQIQAGTGTTLTAIVQNLNGGEVVNAYEWEWASTGATMVVNETSVQPSRLHIYPADGAQTPRVRIQTSAGRSATGTGRVIVYKP